MTKGKKIIISSIVAIGVIAVAGIGSAYAANKIGTVTGKDGDVKEKLSMSAEVIESAGSHLTIKDSETGKTYETSVGPNWYSGTYNNGDKVTVEGVETTGENKNGHTFQIIKINDKTLRESFEGKPAWAGQKGNGTGQGSGQSNGTRNSENSFVDANGDGQCDNQ